MSSNKFKMSARIANNLTISQIGLLLAACGGSQTNTANTGNSTTSTSNTNTSLATIFTDSYNSPSNYGFMEYYNDGSITVLPSDQSAAVTYIFSNEANPPAETANLSGNQFIDGLLTPNHDESSAMKWSSTGNKTIISFSFMNSNSKLDYTDYVVNGDEASIGVYNNQIQNFTDSQKGFIRKALSEWSDVANIEFVEVQELGNDVGTIRFGATTYDDDSWGWTWFGPTNNFFSSAADIWLPPNTMNGENSANYGNHHLAGNAWAPGTNEYLTLMHEIGHAIGLEHPHDGFVFPNEYDSTKFTVMSYETYRNDFLESSPMVYDIAAVQYLYGTNFSTNASNTVYKFQSGIGTTDVPPMLDTIWDGGGIDLIDMSLLQNSCDINLNDGTYSKVGYSKSGWVNDYNLGIALGTIIENANGGSASDIIRGNEYSNQIDGNGGNDIIYGGGGSDIFVCSVGGGSDIIKDFDPNEDLVAFFDGQNYTKQFSESVNASGDLVLSMVDNTGSLTLENIVLGTEIYIA